MYTSFRRKQKGFTLTEAAIVLGVVGLILGAIWGAATAVRSRQMVNRAITDITRITENIRTMNGRPFFSQASIDLLPAATTARYMNAGAIPPELVVNPVGPIIHHPWGDRLLVEITDADTFYLHLQNMPRSACPQLVSRLATGDRSGVNRVVAGAVDTPITGPVDLPTAMAMCGVNETIANFYLYFDLQ